MSDITKLADILEQGADRLVELREKCEAERGRADKAQSQVEVLEAENAEMKLRYRVCWSASSNITFRGHGAWHEAEEGETRDEIEAALDKGDGDLSEVLEMALAESGFECWLEFEADA